MALEKVADGGACACVLRAACWLKWARWVTGLLLDLQGIGKCWKGCWRAARESLRSSRPAGLLDHWTAGPLAWHVPSLGLLAMLGCKRLLGLGR